MTKMVADASAVLTAEDTLVLVSTATPVEMELIMASARHPTEARHIEALPRNAPPAALTALVEQLGARIQPAIWRGPHRAGSGDLRLRRDRAGRARGRTAPGLRDPYHPSQRQQRRILRTDPRRGWYRESAKVTELRQQWRDTTVAELMGARFRPVAAERRCSWRAPNIGSLTAIQISSAGEAG